MSLPGSESTVRPDAGVLSCTLLLLLVLVVLADATLDQRLIAQSACSGARAVRRSDRLTESLEATKMLS